MRDSRKGLRYFYLRNGYRIYYFFFLIELIKEIRIKKSVIVPANKSQRDYRSICFYKQTM